MSEWSGRKLGSAERNGQLEQYYRAYLDSSYFLELHDGWFEASDVYRISERSRSDRSGAGVPLEYSAADDYWQVCERRTDAQYLAWSESRVGGDSRIQTQVAAGMAHHSQFKCVEILSADEYGDAYNASDNPEIVFKHSNPAGIARRRAGPGTFNRLPGRPYRGGIEVRPGRRMTARCRGVSGVRGSSS